VSDTGPIQSNQSRNFFSVARQWATSVVTLKRLGWSTAGAFAFVGATLALNGSAPLQDATPAKENTAHTSLTQDSSSKTSSTEQDNSAGAASTNTSYSSTTSGGKTTVNFEINGQDIPVPANSSTHQTITNNDGTHTDITTNSSTQGSASNTYSSTTTTSISSYSSSTNVSTNGGTTTP
jgi:hypothetical protein